MGVLSGSRIRFCEGLNTKEEVIRLLAGQAVAAGISDDAEEVYAAFMEREAMGPTGIGEGIAVPHARSTSVREVAVMVVKSKTPVTWESFDDGPVYLAIALLVPEENPDNVHLKILSTVTRKLVNEEFKQSLFLAGTADEIMALFKELK